jgi:hypothetical protein
MTKRKATEREILGTIFLGISAFTFVMSVVYLVKFVFFSENFMDEMVAIAFAFTMLYGSLLGVGFNYTIRVPRGKDDDFSQIVSGIVMMFLGTIICASMQILIGVGSKYMILPIVFYVQNWLMLLVALYSLKLYKK